MYNVGILYFVVINSVCNVNVGILYFVVINLPNE